MAGRRWERIVIIENELDMADGAARRRAAASA
jgi:hypothetical protein